MQIRIIVILSIVMIFQEWVQAQVLKRHQFPIINNSLTLKNPYTGGLGNPQFSNIDANFDGKQDLYVFDRLGNVSLLFLAQANGEYTYSPELSSKFPVLADWVLLRDYNFDGIQDIFSSSSNTVGISGIEVYKGYNDGGSIGFEKYRILDKSIDILLFPVGNTATQLYVEFTDIPIIDDIDSDGDIDVISFESGGTKLYYYKNQVVERGLSKDTIVMQLDDVCWGRFFESGISPEIILSGSSDTCAKGFTGPISSTRHSGSTLMSFDADSDGDKDLLVGDLISSGLNFLTNGGDKSNAWITKQQLNFPSYDEPVFIPEFVAAFQADVNGDNKLDLIASPNAKYLSNSIQVAWLYLNVSQTNVPKYEYQQDDYLVDQTLDLGYGTHPVFVDVNQDGLLDLVIGVEGNIKVGGIRDSRILIYQNVGTRTQSVFKLVDTDYQKYNAFTEFTVPYWGFTPSFGDLDSDGDIDMLVGESYGHFFYSENIAGAGNPFNFKAPVYDYQSLNIKAFSTPCLVDLNRDGLTDIVAAARVNTNDVNSNPCGTFYYFQNQGTKNNPIFNPDPLASPNTNCLGQVIVNGVGSKSFATPFVYDFDGKYTLFSGNFYGEIKVYSKIDNNLQGKFEREHQLYGLIREGERSHVAVADVNNDGILDMVVGNQRGGLVMYETDYRTDGTKVAVKDEQVSDIDVKISNQSIQLVFENSEPRVCSLYSMDGKLLHTFQVASASFTTDISQLKSGVYVLQVQSKTSKHIDRFIKM